MLKTINKVSLFSYISLYITFGVIGYFNTSDITHNKINFGSSFSTFFVNNLKYGLLLAIGALSLGLLSLILHCVNSYILGSIIKENILEHHSFFEILHSLPHAIFEIPALYFFFTIGISPIPILLSYLLKENYRFNIQRYTLYVFVYLILGSFLLILAGLTEAYISK